MEQIKEFINKNSQMIMYVAGGVLLLLVLWHIYSNTSYGICGHDDEKSKIDQEKLIQDINKKINEMDLCGCGGKSPDGSPMRTPPRSPEQFGNTNFY